MSSTTTTTPTLDASEASFFDNLKETRDAMTVSRVFGDAYEVDDLTIIPVARVGGGGGGGGGEGTDDEETGKGFGAGFGIGAQPLGVYEVRDGDVHWEPAIDVNRIVKGAQILTGIITICATAIWIRRN